MPPVAPTAMPAFAAAQIVALTVVAPSAPLATADRVVAARDLRRGARLREPRQLLVGRAPPSRSPSTTPIHAGTAPAARIAAFIRSTHSRFLGDGSPWPITLVSSATTPCPASSAARDLLADRERASSTRPPPARSRRSAAASAPAWHARRSASSSVARRARAPRAAPRRTRRRRPVAIDLVDRLARAPGAIAPSTHRDGTLRAELHAHQRVALPQHLRGRLARRRPSATSPRARSPAAPWPAPWPRRTARRRTPRRAATRPPRRRRTASPRARAPPRPPRWVSSCSRR